MISCAAQATVVEIRTVMGDIQVNLFDQATPQTVDNFLDYVNSGAFMNNIVHRSEPNFVIQMGGFQYTNSFPPSSIPTGTPVTNEPALSNLRGTLAMAKLGGDPNSATSQFFINLSNNSANLDIQNGGFAVFGQVIGDGMTVVDQIAALSRFNLGGVYTAIPLRNYTTSDATAGTTPDDENLVIITDIVVIDATTNTNTDLNPAPNTLINQSTNPPTTPGDSGSGGILSIYLIGALALITIARRRIPTIL